MEKITLNEFIKKEAQIQKKKAIKLECFATHYFIGGPKKHKAILSDIDLCPKCFQLILELK